MNKTWFRSNAIRGLKSGKYGIDKKNGVIHGFAVISKGEASGHDMDIDETTLDQVVSLGNKSNLGIKSRFGHPNMSSEALGIFLGRVKNFYRDGDIVRADLFIDKTAYKTPNGDLGHYVLDIAESDPDAFGASIVFTGKTEYRVNEDGVPKKDKNGKTLNPITRIDSLHTVDVVDDPAANSGFFSKSVQISAELTTFLDKLLLNPEAVQKIIGFLNRYSINETEKKEENNFMDPLKEVTLEQLKKDRPDLVQAILQEIASTEFDKGKSAGKTEGESGERSRIVDVLNSTKEFETFGLHAQIMDCVSKGLSKDESLNALKMAHYSQLKNQANPAPGANKSDEEHFNSSDEIDVPIDEETAKKNWESNVKLREEFMNFKDYFHFAKANSEGRVRIFKK